MITNEIAQIDIRKTYCNPWLSFDRNERPLNFALSGRSQISIGISIGYTGE